MNRRAVGASIAAAAIMAAPLPAAFAAAAATAVAAPLPPLPALNIDRTAVTASGISSGADMVAQLAVAFSDVFIGTAIYAGQPWACAVHKFAGEPETACSAQPAGHQGPGCVGYPDRAPCIGCSSGNVTVGYDHCKQPALPLGPGWVDVDLLATAALDAAASGVIAPIAGLTTARTYLERGSLDTVYLDGAVNNTAAFFTGFATRSSQVAFVADIPHQHAQLTADPWLSTDSCGGTQQPWAPPAMQNCGYDAAGAALQHIYQGSLATPPSLAFQHPQYLYAFDQTPFFTAAWPGLSSVGYVYIPPACGGMGGPPSPPSSSSSSSGVSCKLHVSLHGCGMSVWSPQMNTSFVEHSGFNAWADANNIVVLYPQGGGYIENGWVAPSSQMAEGCWDSYGQTGADYAFSSGLQMATIRAMLTALGGI